jgi:hypothetical protein
MANARIMVCQMESHQEPKKDSFGFAMLTEQTIAQDADSERDTMLPAHGGNHHVKEPFKNPLPPQQIAQEHKCKKQQRPSHQQNHLQNATPPIMIQQKTDMKTNPPTANNLS